MGNLRPFTKENAAYYGRRGGIASGKVRRSRSVGKEANKTLPAFNFWGRDKDCTLKQHRFVLEYMLCGNATHAARMAGYSYNSAKQYGWQLLRKPKVQRVMWEISRYISEGGR